MNRHYWRNMEADIFADQMSLVSANETIYLTPLFLPDRIDVREIWMEIPNLGTSAVSLALYEQLLPERHYPIVEPSGNDGSPDGMVNTPTFRLVRAPELRRGSTTRYRARFSKPEVLDPAKQYAVGWSVTDNTTIIVGKLSMSYTAFTCPTWTQVGRSFGEWPTLLAPKRSDNTSGLVGNPQFALISDRGLRCLAV